MAALAALVTVGAISSAGATASAAGHQAKPHIVVSPDSAPVGSSISVHGTHFSAETKVRIEECSAKSWIAPQNPCAKHDTLTVTTDKAGRFNGTMTAEICPSPRQSARGRGAHGYAQYCYVGEPQPQGVDVIHLSAARRIEVTGP
jgi:hypothetical protein